MATFPTPVPIPILTSSSDDADDPFTTPQNLESTYYDEGFALGQLDGTRAGRIEGRVFGLEKGYEKFFAMGALAGRAGAWGARLASEDEPTAQAAAKAQRRYGEDDVDEGCAAEGGSVRLPPLPPRARLRAHLHALHALAEPASLETRNTEDGVADFDDRFRRAQAKVKVVEGLVGERAGEEDGDEEGRHEGQPEGGEGEELAVEVTMRDVEVRLEEDERERDRQRRETENDKPTASASTATSGSGGGAASAKKTPRAPKRAGVKAAGGAQRRGEKNMEDFGIGDARALGRLV